MPITKFQKNILILLKANRNPESYVAGGTAINKAEDSSRFSNDIDFFHEATTSVSFSSKADIETLKSNNYQVEIILQQAGFVRAIASLGQESLKLEWVVDTAFRFFPIIEDEDFGYRLHDIDLAINKCLALANRNEVRDIIDLIQLNQFTLSLKAICWAACGKDPGFTPGLLLDQLSRNSIIRTEQLEAEALAQPITAVELKQQWLAILTPLQNSLKEFPAKDLGCLYINNKGDVVKNPRPSDLSNYQRHFGSIRGAWPREYL